LAVGFGRRVRFAWVSRVFRGARRNVGFALGQKLLSLSLRLALAGGSWTKNVLWIFAVGCKNSRRSKMHFARFGNLPGLSAVAALRPRGLEVLLACARHKTFPVLVKIWSATLIFLFRLPPLLEEINRRYRKTIINKIAVGPFFWGKNSQTVKNLGRIGKIVPG
jgi:hypothetical protein